MRTFASSTKYTALEKLLPHIDFNYNPYELARHGNGESHHKAAPPDVIVTPESTIDIQTILNYACKERIPVIPFGAGTSLEGHINAIHGGISLDMCKFQSTELPTTASAETDTGVPDAFAVVGPGVTRKQLNNALRHSGLAFVVDPGADATIGGMVSTGASGTSTVRYGSMRDNILELECIVPLKEGATIVKTGTKALKNSAGYDLLSLFCGSEGTLGVITSVTVKLHPVVEHIVAAVCQFGDLTSAAQVVAALRLSNIPLYRCELLDKTAVVAFNEYNRDESLTLPVEATLFLEFQGYSEASLHEQIALTQEMCSGFGGSNFKCASAAEDRATLWSARHSLYYASIASRKGTSGPKAIVTDACVPLSQFARVLDETVKDVQSLGVVGTCFGHAGDGNFHVILPIKDDDTAEYLGRLQEVNDNLIRRTLQAGGTCSGEHGIGYGKMKYLEQQYGAGALAVMKAVKQGLDPYNIMNPGKIVDLTKT